MARAASCQCQARLHFFSETAATAQSARARIRSSCSCIKVNSARGWAGCVSGPQALAKAFRAAGFSAARILIENRKAPVPVIPWAPTIIDFCHFARETEVVQVAALFGHPRGRKLLRALIRHSRQHLPARARWRSQAFPSPKQTSLQSRAQWQWLGWAMAQMAAPAARAQSASLTSANTFFIYHVRVAPTQLARKASQSFPKAERSEIGIELARATTQFLHLKMHHCFFGTSAQCMVACAIRHANQLTALSAAEQSKRVPCNESVACHMKEGWSQE